MTDSSNGEAKSEDPGREKERPLVWGGGREVGIERGKNKSVKDRGRNRGWNFSITPHTDNKDPDFNRL